MDPFGSLLSAIYLQGSKDSKYPKLDPRSDDNLELWIMRCANFGYSDSASMSCTAKNLMSHFYQIYFPEGLHKLSKNDIAVCQQILMDSYSDDVLMSVFISTIQKENECPSFKHPPNWSQLSDIEKAHLLVKVIFLKLLAIVDFSDMAFKEASSLFKEIDFLNQETRLECNKTKQIRHVDKVQEEIMETRTRIDFYRNDSPDQFPSNNNKFKFLGILTDRETDMMRLKGKPLSFKSRSKGSVDIVIRNTAEFRDFCAQGLFQRQHLSSLVAQTFDPLMCLNSVFLCIARLLNREITSEHETTMPMTHQIHPQIL